MDLWFLFWDFKLNFVVLQVLQAVKRWGNETVSNKTGLLKCFFDVLLIANSRLALSLWYLSPNMFIVFYWQKANSWSLKLKLKSSSTCLPICWQMPILTPNQPPPSSNFPLPSPPLCLYSNLTVTAELQPTMQPPNWKPNVTAKLANAHCSMDCELHPLRLPYQPLSILEAVLLKVRLEPSQYH